MLGGDWQVLEGYIMPSSGAMSASSASVEKNVILGVNVAVCKYVGVQEELREGRCGCLQMVLNRRKRALYIMREE